MDAPEQLTVARILKVNHAGEYGAIRIYRAQIWIARRRYPDVVAFLEETLGHEVNHCSLFLGAMPERHARPCRIMTLWGNGGLVLGLLTALLGRQGIWICTAAVEAAVHRHLQDQLLFLRNRDPGLYSLIEAIQSEELMHLDHAEERIVVATFWSRLLRVFISNATEAAIWLSTWGDSAKMAKELAAARHRP
jgi:ubiquinone biosynthesis monooxygenase Coq7